MAATAVAATPGRAVGGGRRGPARVAWRRAEGQRRRRVTGMDISVDLGTGALWTANELAGFVAGIVVVGVAFGASRIDQAVAKAQRQGLGLCPECGGTRLAKSGTSVIPCPACSARAP